MTQTQPAAAVYAKLRAKTHSDVTLGEFVYRVRHLSPVDFAMSDQSIVEAIEVSQRVGNALVHNGPEAPPPMPTQQQLLAAMKQLERLCCHSVYQVRSANPSGPDEWVPITITSDPAADKADPTGQTIHVSALGELGIAHLGTAAAKFAVEARLTAAGFLRSS